MACTHDDHHCISGESFTKSLKEVMIPMPVSKQQSSTIFVYLRRAMNLAAMEVSLSASNLWFNESAIEDT